VAATPATTSTRELIASLDAKGRVKLTTAARVPFTHISRGSYAIVVDDRSRTAGFHVTGSGVDRRTGAKFTGRVRWTLKLVPGRYLFGADGRRTTLRVV
jgi:hypothetical protein